MDIPPRAHVEELARLHVTMGYAPIDEVLETVQDAADNEGGLDEDAVADIVHRVWRERLAEQAGWPTPTDVDRLERAFAVLAGQGIVARGNFACCQTCGVAEIGDDVAPDQQPDGYTFFHQQDTAHAAEGGPLYLAYGTFGGPSEATDEAIGRRVVTALEAEALPVAWNGSSDVRIAVQLDWKRRLPTPVE